MRRALPRSAADLSLVKFKQLLAAFVIEKMDDLAEFLADTAWYCANQSLVFFDEYSKSTECWSWSWHSRSRSYCARRRCFEFY